MRTSKNGIVAILGISDRPERYSYKAAKMLQQNGHNSLWGVTPKEIQFPGVKVVSKLEEISERVDTLTVYVGPSLLAPMIDDILRLNPRRIILNPGTENVELERLAGAKGIEVERACTLVLLSTDQF